MLANLLVQNRTDKSVCATYSKTTCLFVPLTVNLPLFRMIWSLVRRLGHRNRSIPLHGSAEILSEWLSGKTFHATCECEAAGAGRE